MKRWAGVLTALGIACAPGSASAAVVYMYPTGDEFSPGRVSMKLTADPGEAIRGEIVGTDPVQNNLPYTPGPRSVRISLDAGTLTTVPATDAQIPCEIRSAQEAVCRAGDGHIGAVRSTLADANDNLVLSSAGAPIPWFVDAKAGVDSILLSRGTVGGFRWGSEPYIRGGAGNDRITVLGDPTAPGSYSMIVWGEGGNDTIRTANGQIDQVYCGEGSDTWINDPLDEPIYPAEVTECETAGPTLWPAA